MIELICTLINKLKSINTATKYIWYDNAKENILLEKSINSPK